MRALLVGNPNSGKTTLFNALTGLSARTGNYPGITVEHREGDVELGTRAGPPLRLIDLPGTYSLVPRSDDEAVAVRGVLGTLPVRDGESGAPDLVIVVVDATALERNLYLCAQLLELPVSIVVALTMMDTVERDGQELDVATLARRLGVPVVAAPAVAGGTDALRAQLLAMVDGPARRLALNPPPVEGDDDNSVRAAGLALVHALAKPSAASTATTRATVGAERALGLFAAGVHAAGSADRLGLADDVVAVIARVGRAEAVAQAAIQARYTRVGAWTQGIVTARADVDDRLGALRPETRTQRFTRRIDAVALQPVLGPVLLAAVFLALFQALFSWSTPLMDGIEALMGGAGAVAAALVPDSLPLLRSLLVNGVVAGVGNVVVFVPQIAVLFLFLSLLEDSGYLARAAFLLDKVMARVGLHGRAFVPLLSGFACAVPAIMATRTIENDKDRIVTILVTPLISCSARLPVYALMIATVFSTQAPLFGVLSMGALVMITMYLLSIAAAIGMAFVFKRTLLKSPTPPLILELPPYRMPKASAVVRAVLSRVRIFLVEAGTVILAITVVLWALFTFPRDQSIEQARSGAVAAVEATVPAGPAREAELAKVSAKAASLQLEQSIAGRMGHGLEPLIAPLGFDWKIGVGLVASFAAREVLVSTLGLVYGLGDGTDEQSVSLRDALRADRRPDGKPVYTPLVGLSLLVFFVLAMQCMSTLAATKRETRGWKWPAVQLGYMTLLAYGASLLVFQIGSLLGFA